MKKTTILLSAALMFFGLTAKAQTTITFDTEDYKSVGVYDKWEESPFRTGELEGNAGIALNPSTTPDAVLGVAPNTTEKVVAFQRSRYGSNVYGVRIDLKEPIRVTKQLQYVHVMTYLKDKPTASRMMVIGLGRRLEESWSGQAGKDVEQFWSYTTTNVEPKDGWQDIVVSFKGFSYSKEENENSGIDLHALVIVPDVRTPDEDAADWVAYFDEIVVDGNPNKRFSTEQYALTYDKEAVISRGDRALNKVGLTVGDKTYESAAKSKRYYSDNTTTSVFSAKAGAEVQPTFGYSGNWMSGYVYVDWGNDALFKDALNADGTPAAGSDVVSYNTFQIDGTWYKSDGTTRGDGNGIGQGVPKFTVPAGTPAGFYRMRYKVDWNSINPAGGNTIITDGGGIVDLMLDVHGDEVTVNASQLNGDIYAADGTDLISYVAGYEQPFKVKIVPAPGFVQYGFKLKYGYNVTAKEQLDDKGNPNWIEVNVPYTEIAGDGTYTIPAEYMRGSQVSIEGDMQQVQQYTVAVVGLEGQGGAVYANIETLHGGTINATQFFSVEQVEAIAVEGYTANVTLNDRVVTVTYEIAAEPYRTVSSLSELKNYKLYQIKSNNNEGYLAWNHSITDQYLSLRGVTNFGSGEPSAEVRAQYAEEVNPFDETVVWQIRKEGDSYYLYHPAKNAYVTRSGRDYQFTDTKTALDAIRDNGDGTFSFHAGGGYSDGSTNFACIVTNSTPMAVRNWTWDDHGAVMQIIENPNVYTLEYAVEITGHNNGAIVYEGTDYANGSTITTTKFFTAEDVVVKTMGLYSSKVSLNKESKKITVQYIAPKVVTAINPEMFYTLECRSGAAHSTTRFIGDNGTVIDGRSSEPTFFMFEPGETDGTYYIKSVVSGKYINSDGTNLSASTTKSTAWTFGVGGKDKVANVVTFGRGDKYLNNNGTKCSDGSVVNLQPNSHSGGPGSGNACSLWEMCEFEPDYNDYQVAILGDATATVTFDGEQYENGATIRTLGFIQKDDVIATEVAGKVTIVNVEGGTIYVSYFDATTQFYTIKNHKGGYVSLNASYTDGNGNLKLTNSSAIADEKGLWAFIGNDTDGYKVYNYTTGLFKVLGMTGSEASARASMVSYDSDTHTTTFYGAIDLENGEASYIKLANDGDNYWNMRDGYLALWNSANAYNNKDEGSRFYLTKVDYASFFTPEAVTIGAHEISTFYANMSAYIPEGVKAYVATTAPVMNDGEGTITMTEITDGIIPAKTGVVLRGVQGDYSFIYTASAGTPVAGNLLRGYAGTAEYAEVTLPEDGSVNYVLTAPEGKEAGFYRKDKAFKVYNHKAYLNVAAAQNVRSLAIRFEGDGTTGIENMESTANGQLSAVIYDLQGRCVVSPAKGVYIVNGKKYVIQ